jgi:hypothetical protein
MNTQYWSFALAKLLLVSVLLQCVSAAREDTLVGWQGEQYKNPSEDHRRVRFLLSNQPRIGHENVVFGLTCCQAARIS